MKIDNKLSDEARHFIASLIANGQANETGKGRNVTHKFITKNGVVIGIERVRFN